MTEYEKILSQEITALTGVEAEKLMEIGLVEPKQAKKWLVRHHYYTLAKTGRTYTDIKYELSDRYGISVSSIEKMVYRKSTSAG